MVVLYCLLYIIFLCNCDDMWVQVWTDDSCTEKALWTQRITTENCTEMACFDGPFGKTTIACDSPSLAGFCHIKKFANTSTGRECYCDPSLCYACTNPSTSDDGFCQWKHTSDNSNSLRFTFFTDSQCTLGEDVQTDYMKDTCVIDFLDDPDVFMECDDWSENWFLVYSEAGCTGDVIWMQRNEVQGECSEMGCFDSAFGPSKILCSEQSTDGLCHIKKYDRSSSGVVCNERAYIADGYANPKLCVDYTRMSLGYCKLVHEVGHLKFNCYTDEACTADEVTMTDYVKDTCVVDFFQDPDVFVGCTDTPVDQYVAQYYDDACTQQFGIRRETIFYDCSVSGCVEVAEGIYEKTTCEKPTKEIWLQVYDVADTSCTGTPTWTQRIDSPADCVDIGCFSGGFGPTIISCTQPDLGGLCKIKKYDHTQDGLACNSDNYVSDGYGNPNLCMDFRHFSMGYCTFNHYHDSPDELNYDCYSDDKCTLDKQTMSTYTKDTCYVDYLGDPDVFEWCDSWDEHWVQVYTNDDCIGTPTFIQRVDIIGQCAESGCAVGEFGMPQTVSCGDNKPDVTNHCRIKKYDRSEGGKTCEERTYFSDGYVNLVECVDYSVMGIGYCKWFHDYGHLYFKCFDDNKCTQNEQIINDYIQDVCVIDTFNDPDVFVGCDGSYESDTWITSYVDDKCTIPIAVAKTKVIGDCISSDQCKKNGDIFEKVGCTGPTSEQWKIVFSGPECTGEAIWTEKVKIPGSCVESECYDGSYGPEQVFCTSPNLGGMCRIKKFDHTDNGKECNPENYMSDGYVNPAACMDFTTLGMGYCQWKLSVDPEKPGHFMFNCYSDEKCQEDEYPINEYIKDTCVVDNFGDPDMFISCDTWSENWFMVYQDALCEKDPIWVQRNEINGECSESPCAIGDFGPSKVLCEKPDISGLCHLKKYDKSLGGTSCADRAYIGDGYADPTLCMDMNSYGMGYCRWVHQTGHLKYTCFTDNYCEDNPIVYTDYVKDECVFDFLGDHDVFAGCDDDDVETLQWITYYADGGCTKPFWTTQMKVFGACSPQDCTTNEDYGVNSKVECVEPVFNERRCLVRNFDKNSTMGKQCGSGFHWADGYGVLGQCIDFSKMGQSYCQLKESDDQMHLYFYCYSDKGCKKDETLVTDYQKDTCVVDHFGDPDMFIMCDSRNLHAGLVLQNSVFLGFFIWLAVSFVICCVLVVVLLGCLIVMCGRTFSSKKNDGDYKKLEENITK